MGLSHAGSDGEVPCLTWPSRAPPAASTASNRSSARRRRTSSVTSAPRSRGTASICPAPTSSTASCKDSDRPTPVLRSLQSLFSHGRLDGTGYVSILPVDQGIEHSAGASFAKNPDYFDPEGIVKLAIEGGCNAVASTLGVLGACARKYAHHIPFIVKLNHNEFLSYPNAYDQIMFGQVRQAREMGAVAVGATIYFGSRRVQAADRRGLGGLRGGPRARPGHDPLVLPAQLGLQPHEGRRAGLPPRRRPDGPGQPPGRHDRGRHHQAEAARDRGARASSTSTSARPTSASTAS